MRDKSRKPVSRCKNLGLKISAQTIVSFDSDRIRRLEIKDLEINKRSRDFEISSRIAKISRLTGILKTVKTLKIMKNVVK